MAHIRIESGAKNIDIDGCHFFGEPPGGSIVAGAVKGLRISSSAFGLQETVAERALEIQAGASLAEVLSGMGINSPGAECLVRKAVQEILSSSAEDVPQRKASWIEILNGVGDGAAIIDTVLQLWESFSS